MVVDNKEAVPTFTNEAVLPVSSRILRYIHPVGVAARPMTEGIKAVPDLAISMLKLRLKLVRPSDDVIGRVTAVELASP